MAVKGEEQGRKRIGDGEGGDRGKQPGWRDKEMGRKMRDEGEEMEGEDRKRREVK